MISRKWMTAVVASSLASGCALATSEDHETALGSHVAALQTDLVFDFEDGTSEGFERAWGDAFDPTLASVTQVALGEGGALRVNLAFKGSDWEEANLQTWLGGTPNTRLDLTGYTAVEYDLLVPNPDAFTGVLKLATALNWDWQELSSHADLALALAPRVTLDGVEYARVHRIESLTGAQHSQSGQLTVRLAAYRSTYVGPVYLDNVVVRASDDDDDGGEPAAGAPIVFNFEDGTAQGFGAGWGGAFDSATTPVLWSADLARADNSGSLRVNLAFTGASWEEANTQVQILPSGELPSFGLYEAIEYDVYLPTSPAFNGTLKMQTALNGVWNELTVWSDISLANTERVTIAGREMFRIHRSVSQSALANAASSRQLVLRVAANGSTYRGPIYVDDVRFVPLSKPTFLIQGPSDLALVSGVTKLRAQVFAPAAVTVDEISVTDSAGHRILLADTGGLLFEGDWDASSAPSGLVMLTFALTAGGETFTKTLEVRVDNSGMALSILEPTFDASASGSLRIRAKLDSLVDSSAAVQVTARLGGLRTLLRDSGNAEYVGMLDVRKLRDRAHTLVVEATRDGRSVKRWTEVAVDNIRDDAFVRRVGADFYVRKTKFPFVGYNAYDLPFKYESVSARAEKTVTYVGDEVLVDVLPAGTRLSFEQQVDRGMIEASKLDMTVVRTWAFNSDLADAHSFYNPDWSVSEKQLARLDYVLDSARRHGLRVILPFENYWEAYGGIAVTAKRFGVPKLAFFSDARCQQMFRDYIATLVKRVNTINGRAYRNDPTIFAWEAMNEPRMGLRDDTSADKSLYDPTGDRLGAWLERTARYVKSLDKNHMVGPGSEGHGIAGWGGTDEGYGDDPLRVMDQPSIDFFTFHPYLNESWARFSVGQAKTLISTFMHAGLARNKPVVMEEWGFNKHEAVLDLLSEPVEPSSARYDQVRAAWYEMLGATLRREGGNGNMVWMLQTNLQESHFGISLFSPYSEAVKDRGLASGLANQAWYMEELGGADFVRDARPGQNPFSGYIHEVVFLGLMPLDPWQRFWPSAPTTKLELRRVLEGLGLDGSSVRQSWTLVTMDQAAQAVYDALGLSSWGSDVHAVLAQFDLQPRDEHGTCVYRRVMTRAELASLALRVSDFLLYQ